MQYVQLLTNLFSIIICTSLKSYLSFWSSKSFPFLCRTSKFFRGCLDRSSNSSFSYKIRNFNHWFPYDRCDRWDKKNLAIIWKPLSSDRSDRSDNDRWDRTFLSQLFLSQTLTRLFQLAQCWQIFLELSKQLHWSLGKKKKVVFCSRLPQDREIRHFHIVVVQRQQWNTQ